MPLHHTHTSAEAFGADVYASRAVEQPVPKWRIPQHGLRADVAFNLVRDELSFDGNARQNLATFCQTWLDDEIHRLMSESIDKNMVDRDEYPATAEIELRCVHIIADLWHIPRAQQAVGCSTVGSSEAAMLSGLAMKRRWQAARHEQGKPADRPNLITGPVQVCWHKFTRYFDVELREIPMVQGRLGMTPEEVASRVDDNTIGVVPTLGVTFTGRYEPVSEIAAGLDAIERERGLDIPIHVDAASGGFLAPFIEPDLVWDFRLPRVRSINASGHKFGLAPLGVGWVMWRDKVSLPDELVFWVNYLGGNMPDFALNFSRPGGQVIAQYYLLMRLGREGYRAIQRSCYDVAHYLATRLAKIGPFEILFDGDSKAGIPAVCWTLKPDANVTFSLFDLSDRLRTRGWQVAAYTLVPDLQQVVVMRALVRHGFSRDMAETLLSDLHTAMAYFAKHPQAAVADSTVSGSDPHGGQHPSRTQDKQHDSVTERQV
jgi:glutamate decarboxylase